MDRNVKLGAALDEKGQTNQTLELEMTDFARAVAIINALKSGGKISHEDAYQRLRDLWQRLESEHRRLRNLVA